MFLSTGVQASQCFRKHSLKCFGWKVLDKSKFEIQRKTQLKLTFDVQSCCHFCISLTTIDSHGFNIQGENVGCFFSPKILGKSSRCDVVMLWKIPKISFCGLPYSILINKFCNKWPKVVFFKPSVCFYVDNQQKVEQTKKK